jgi:V8-like Glu-specific endopeptidase
MTTKILGDESALQDTWSWIVSLRDEYGHFCAGSILNERYIITTAHCLEERIHRLSNITICAGIQHLSDTCRQLRAIHNITSHASYDNQTLENDIALIYVSIPFDFTDTSIAPICLPDTIQHSENSSNSTNIVAIGWEKTKAKSQLNALQQVTVQVMDKYTNSCNSTATNHDLQLCADTCQGDSGSPLMIFTESKHWELIGITSYGADCAEETPGIYTRITAFLSFIQTMINNTSSERRTPICTCQCRHQNELEFICTRENSTEACVAACKDVSWNGCVSSNTYACNETNCTDSTSYLLSDNNIYNGICIWLNGDHCEGQFKNKIMHGRATCKYTDGNNYTGDWIEGKRTGHGVFSWPNGHRYEGHFDNDVRVGYGIYYWPSGDQYEGQFKNSRMHGRGKYKYANGNNYTGDWIEGNQTGYGVYSWINGDRYEGQFKNGNRHGTGTCKYANGNNYTGDWIQDEKSGHGVFNWFSGHRYEGQFHRDIRVGYGIYNSPSGDRYKGQFKNSKMHGTGTYYFSSGDNYTGDWIEGNRTGYGVFSWSDGDRYEGQFKDDDRHGKGTQYYSSGGKYTGDWIEGYQTGYGMYIGAAGDRYAGQFNNSERHGKGTQYYVNGNIYIGEWIEGKQIGYGVFLWTGGDRYEKSYSLISRDHILQCQRIYLLAIDAMSE